MKHVFLANSNLHGRNCIAVAEILKPDPDDIIFLHRRKLKLNHGHKQICLMDDLGWKFLPYSSFPKLVIYLIYLSIILRPKFNAKLNAYLDKDKFIIYVPHIFSADIRLLINHENCCGICVVDEGTNGFFQKVVRCAFNKYRKTKRFKFLAALLGILHIVNRDSVMPN